MPKKRKTQKQGINNKNINLTVNMYKPTGKVNTVKYHPVDLAPFPPKINDPQDFASDPVTDGAFNMDATDFTDKTATTSASTSDTTTNTASGTKLSFGTGVKIPMKMKTTPSKSTAMSNIFKTNKDEGTVQQQRKMPKKKRKTQKQGINNKNINLTVNMYKPTGKVNTVKYHPVDLAPFPPKINDPQDFASDLVTDGAFNMDATDFTDKTATTSASTSDTTTNTASGKKLSFGTGVKIPMKMKTTPSKSTVMSNIFKTNKDEGTVQQQRKMPKKRKTQKQGINNKNINLTVNMYKPTGKVNTVKYHPVDLAPFPPKINDPQDFASDPVTDGAFNMDATDFTDKTATTSASTSDTTTNTASGTKLSFGTGVKIPMKMKTTPSKSTAMSNIFKTNKDEGTSANQQLKDCLSSDIRTVVQDNIKSNEQGQKQQSFGLQNQYTKYSMQQAKVSGTPRSFLTRADQASIEPQEPVAVQPPPRHYIQVIQSNYPITHAGFQQPTFDRTLQNNPPVGTNPQTFGQQSSAPARYSPTDLYDDLDSEPKNDDENHENSESTDAWMPGEKRVSAFDRLGPIAEPKKPKLTINLSFNKEQAVREVVDETEPQKVHVPVHEREDILHSTDETVMKYVALWPWTKNLMPRRPGKTRTKFPVSAGSDTNAAVGHSKTAMLMIKEQMDEVYQRNKEFIGVSVTGYPATWTKEDVLDALLENLKGKTFIPCFIEFSAEECKFVVLRCRQALLELHDIDFQVQKDGVQLQINVSQTVLNVMQLDFIPRLVLRKRVAMLYTDNSRLDLSEFTLKPDVSHFIYYPLNQLTNQIELMDMQSDVKWEYLVELDLSRNRLTTLQGFDIPKRMPKLRHLNLAHNRLESVTILLDCRSLPLKSLWLEGNPLCLDYIEPEHYVTVLKTMFPMLTKLDNMPINLKGDLPAANPNYCPYGSVELIDSFLQIYIPLLESQMEERLLLHNLYTEDALVTITYRPKFATEAGYKFSRSILTKSRVVLEGNLEFSYGQPDIEKLLRRWPNFEHDPSTFTIDVMFHSESSTIFILNGILKLLADSLAENDQLVAFSKTIHLQTTNQVEYKIKNEMIYWDEPDEEYAKSAFRRTAVQRKPLSFKFESPPDEESKKRLVVTFMRLTQMEEKPSERCLEMKDWDLREALEYFMKLYKVDNLQPLFKPIET